MKNLIKLICILVLSLSVNSCGVSWQIQSVNQAAQVDTLYDVDVITTRSQLEWKMQRDWTFANNYYRFLQQQNYSFFQDQYYRNRLYRFGWNGPNDYWMNWQWNWHSGYSNSWMWNQYPYYGNWGSSQWNYYQNSGHWGYSQMYGPRTGYLGNVYGGRYGRRSSNRSPLFNSSSNRSNRIVDSNGSTSDSRTYLQTLRNLSNANRSIQTNRSKPRVLPNTKPRVINKPPVVINKPIRNNTIRVNNQNTRPPVNNSNRRVISNSSSRPNFNRPVSRPSVPQTTTKSPRKRDN